MLDFEIVAQDGSKVSVNRRKLFRVIRAAGMRIYFYTGWILGRFKTCERTFGVWQALKKAARNGDKSFVIPQE